ncbi:hypothetical protein [Sciscionella marina]|uniref:hypothetical protein n=1 Tax=Sciscionella marina TaxID=508770 RepID=UPI0003704B13|nr:hypothetical protein [Sciscionella marina]
MTELSCMTNGACIERAARAEIGGYPLRLAVSTGQLRERFPGVLVRGARAADPLTVASAAILWCGPGSVLCRASAAWLHGCSSARVQQVHVLRPYGRNRSAPSGIRIHHGDPARYAPDTVCGLPTVGLDHALAELLCAPERDFGFAVAEEALALQPVAWRRSFRAGIRARIAERRDPRYRERGDRLSCLVSGKTRGTAAGAALLAIADHGLPVPRLWFPVRDAARRELYRLEFAWPADRLALEMTRAPDPLRDADLRERGWSLIRAGPGTGWLAELGTGLSVALGDSGRESGHGPMPRQGRVRNEDT